MVEIVMAGILGLIGLVTWCLIGAFVLVGVMEWLETRFAVKVRKFDTWLTARISRFPGEGGFWLVSVLLWLTWPITAPLLVFSVINYKGE